MSIHTCLWESRLEGKLWGHEKKLIQKLRVSRKEQLVLTFSTMPSWSRRGTWEPGGHMLRTLRSSMMTPIFLILITNKIYTMTIAINQWMSLFSTICNPCYSGTFDNKIVFWGENILLEIFWYWYTTWTLYGNRGMCLEAGNIILRAVVPKQSYRYSGTWFHTIRWPDYKWFDIHDIFFISN